VPANAVIHIDLVGGTPQGRAWVDGVGEVALTSVVDLTGGELVPQGLKVFTDSSIETNPLLIGDALAWASAHVRAFTFTVEWQDASTADPHEVGSVILTAIEEHIASSGTGIDVGTLLGPPNTSVYASDLMGNYDPLGTIVTDGLNKVAFTYIDNDTYASAFLGGAAIAGPTDGEVNPGYQSFSLGSLGSHAGYIRYFTFYDPLPSTAGLSELSEV
jgi:hypothetical protein